MHAEPCEVRSKSAGNWSKRAGSPDGKADLRLPFRLSHWRERHREAGLTVILILQATIMFVVNPLAGAPTVFGAEVIEALRFALAATAILVVTRNCLIAYIVGLTFVISLVSLIHLRTGPQTQPESFAILIRI